MQVILKNLPIGEMQTISHVFDALTGIGLVGWLWGCGVEISGG